MTLDQDISLVKGFQDYSGKEAEKRAQIRKLLVSIFERYGFNSAETPVIEYEEFVKGKNQGDEAVSDIYKLSDKGNRKLALRYEFTFQLKRLMNNKKLPYKRYQVGEVFRDEPVSSNRFRQFVQADADIIGATIKDDAEILALASEVIKYLEIDFEINVNNRKLLNEILDEQKVKKKEEVIREIDKLGKLSEKEIKANLKRYNAEKVLEIFKKPKSYFKKYSSYSEIEELEKYCGFYGIKFNFSPSLARGLSYYDSSVFEVKTKKLKETIVAGGAYTFNGVKCVGISFGLDRLSSISEIKSEKKDYLVVSLDKDEKAINILSKLRLKGYSASIFFGKPSKALEYANSYEIRNVVFVGEKEIKDKKFRVKDMKTGKESLLEI